MPTWKGIVGEGFKPAEFDNYVRRLTFGAWRPQFVVLHNTSKPRFSQWHSTPGAQRMQNLVHYYRNDMGWSAGPHLFIADDLIWVFTPLTTSGRHSPSWNLISWGVEMVGEYEEEKLGEKVRANTVAALVTLHSVLGREPTTLRFHKEDQRTSHTSCPGRNVIKKDIIKHVEEALLQRYAGDRTPDGPE